MKKTILATITIILVLTVFAYATARHPFVDVPPGAYYADAVQWAWEQGITNGVDTEHFEPNRAITRAEFVTMLWRMNGSPEPTKTITDCPNTPPIPNPTIHPEYALDYYGRLYIGDIYSVGLYDTMDQKLVDLSDAAFIMKRQNGCIMIGDHDTEGLWLIRWCGLGDTIRIEKKDGTVDQYVMQYDDPHVKNVGSDVLDSKGRSCFELEYDLFIATCNDSTGKDMTATFWTLLEETP